jgi:hexosaminidase
MIRRILLRAAIAVALVQSSDCAIANSGKPSVKLVPIPAAMTVNAGQFRVASGMQVSVPTGDTVADRAARRAIAIVAEVRHLRLTMRPAQADAGRPAEIRFERSGTGEGEAYRLSIKRDGIVVSAASDAGLRNGAMTLAQVLTSDARETDVVAVPLLDIADQPRFGWRGVMLDVARHMLSIAEIERIVDQMAQHKLNVLQLHLTDDQGWRIEIKRYPELTRIGAWRTGPSAGSAADAQRYGGFYTQADLRGLVAYAADRGVTIVPEIDLPGHGQAAVAAYPALGVLGDRPPVSINWGVNPYLFDASDRTIAVVKAVLDEVMAIFSSTYIHVGGDEAIKQQWQASPAIQARIRELGLKDEDALQSWFIDTLGRYLAEHKRRLIGWDEILEGGLPPSASVMSWRGEAGAVAAAAQGHDVVLSPSPTLYLNNLESASGDEPPGRLEVQPLSAIYRYDPMPAGIAADRAQHVLGVQANLWSEHIVGPARTEAALFPRLSALAEIGWSPKAARDWPGFLDRLPAQRWRYTQQGIAAADSAYAVTFALADPVATVLQTGKAHVALANQVDAGVIHYSADGRAPTVRSPTYRKPLTLPIGATVQARTFAADGQPLSATRTFDLSETGLLTRDNSRLPLCLQTGGIRLRLAGMPDQEAAAPAYNVNLFDTCWRYDAAPVGVAKAMTVRLGRLPPIFALRADQQVRVVKRLSPARFGTLIARMGTCEGPVVASAAMPDPAASNNRPSVTAAILLPPGAPVTADLCLITIPPEGGPIYALESVRLIRR